MLMEAKCHGGKLQEMAKNVSAEILCTAQKQVDEFPQYKFELDQKVMGILQII